MENSIKKYDYIISLGGNCSTACQLVYRNLRPCAFPFDYFFLRDVEDLKKMISELKSDYKNSFKKENFVELVGDKRGCSKLYQYQDNVSGYNIIHMFHKPIEAKGEYEKVYKTIQKRLNRIMSLQNKNKNLCFILGIDFEPDKNILEDLYKTLKEKFGENIDTFFIMWNSKQDNTIQENNVTYIYTTQPSNLYDYEKTNVIWRFLDFCKIKPKFDNKILMIEGIKKGVQIKILECINTIFRIRLYLAGFRLDICLGKLRD